MGETQWQDFQKARIFGLSVSSNGSLWVKRECEQRNGDGGALSVSSNGSLWVKLTRYPVDVVRVPAFQYPRTDRCG